MTFISKNFKEFIFQGAIIVILFIVYSNLQDSMGYTEENVSNIIPFKIAFYSNYTLASLLISYFLIPFYLSKRKFLLFFSSLIILIAIVILIDEFVLEKIYFPSTRGIKFPGIVFTLVETLPIISIFVGLKFAWDYVKKQKEIEKLKTLFQESELQYLKSQINPHFLFNNLNNLYVYATENSPKTPAIILELSSVLRYMLYDCKEKYVNIEKEIEHLKNYTALNELQIENRGSIHFVSEINTTNFLIAPLILNVFVENAFKHSTASQSENIYISISVTLNTSGLLMFFCENSFLPVTNIKNLDKGIGLINVRKRLDLLYPKSHSLFINEDTNRFQVKLAINLNKQ
ncbi:sensor histidine kinase [Tenacibaculum sp. nBUS_03]|uniref:sensor histidine kinase n=1 Tax=Tenacibaculum sp. nBUS_03 TaxID=3395320 RepID=UPI003EBEE414